MKDDQPIVDGMDVSVALSLKQIKTSTAHFHFGVKKSLEHAAMKHGKLQSINILSII